MSQSSLEIASSVLEMDNLDLDFLLPSKTQLQTLPGATQMAPIQFSVIN